MLWGFKHVINMIKYKLIGASQELAMGHWAEALFILAVMSTCV